MRDTIKALFASIRNLLGVFDASTEGLHTFAKGINPYGQAFASVGEMVNDTVAQAREVQIREHAKLLENL
ncbi:hypothetical protein [Magnetovibrio blakemorei]|uniref:Uncharacterized protein n=1 Tax=Magnetovibrio blakemorei TaxID=28181 RepID=A0A1E5Q340_9PROT|nr:hypothetical protein [Magnetovibrio blakemorei]OEJ64033.1 hypothetical protein BEN30_01090 [Magnetovibrio blakemorei]